MPHSESLLKAVIWAGGNDVLVQLGDIVDRGNQAREIYELFFKLQDMAPLVGGRVILLLGNHEQMRLQVDHHFEHSHAFKNW